jgi:transcriptional regulator with XRE-family HTH domain
VGEPPAVGLPPLVSLLLRGQGVATSGSRPASASVAPVASPGRGFHTSIPVPVDVFVPDELNLPMKIGSALGGELRRARQADGLTCAELARCVGIAPGYLSALERGGCAPSLGLVHRIIQWLPLADNVKAALLGVGEEVERRRQAREALRLRRRERRSGEGGPPMHRGG